MPADTHPAILHWPEYLMEAAALATFMLSACVFGVLLEHPASPVHASIENPMARRALMGMAMGLTAIVIISSRWGRRSGAHMNPAVTLTFLFLKKIRPVDALFYVIAQFAGGMAGMFIASMVVGLPLSDSSVNYVATLPGPRGAAVAFAAEFAISFVLMSTILGVSNSRRLADWTPFCAGALVAAYITLEAPLSGMSMNPARTFGSAWCGDEWAALWIYFTAPLAGMLLAAIQYRTRHGLRRVLCAKLHRCNGKQCIFRCHSGEL